MAALLPCMYWMRGYRRQDLRGDMTAGLTTAVMLIPQSMAYAMLAGLPPIVGLYAATVPLVLYALFGTSRQLAVGPVAMDSILVAAGVGAIAAPGSEAYLAYAVLLAAMAGVLQVSMGLARLGFLVNLLSNPVISGFTSAAALIIGLSQLPHLLGVSLPRSQHVHEILFAAARALGGVSLPTLALGTGGILLLMALKRWNPLFPRALAVVALGALAVWLLGLDARGVATVGHVPAGLPALALPVWDPAAMRALAPTALAIALVAFMEAISVAKAYARRNRYELDPNRELVGLGLANLGAALFRGYPVTGGFSRTAVNAQAGARTPLAALVTASVVAATLLLLTPLFFYLPRAILAAIIMTAVFGLIDLREARRLYLSHRADLALMLITFAATLSLGIQTGILAGVAASLLWFVHKANRPHVAVLGRLPGTSVFRNVRRFPEVETFPGVLIIRVDAPFFFGNVAYLKETLARLERARPEPLRAVILDASSISDMDSSADTALHEIAQDYRQRGIAFMIASANGPVRDAMARSGLGDALGSGCRCRTVQEALDARGDASSGSEATALPGRVGSVP